MARPVIEFHSVAAIDGAIQPTEPSFSFLRQNRLIFGSSSARERAPAAVQPREKRCLFHHPPSRSPTHPESPPSSSNLPSTFLRRLFRSSSRTPDQPSSSTSRRERQAEREEEQHRIEFGEDERPDRESRLSASAREGAARGDVQRPQRRRLESW